jgi:tetratricopeptide (TPR) repeat protein
MLIAVIRVRLLHSLRYLVTVSILALPCVTASRCFGQEKSPQTEEQRQAREALDKGVQDYKNAQYEEATRDFLRAKQLDSKLLNARLYLATTYASQYIPGAPSDENIRNGQAAVEEFRGALSLDPQNIPAIDGLGSMLFQMAGSPYDPDLFQESKSYHQKHIYLRPNDPEPYYWVGVIDWTLTYRANSLLRTKHNLSVRGKQLSDDAPLPPDLRDDYVREYGATIDEGIESLKHAISIKPDYDDAMAYLNLMYRRKADTVANESEREQLIKMADDLVDKVKDIKQKRAEEPSQP